MSIAAKTIIGTSADEFMFGTSDDDVIVSRVGSDMVFGGWGNDTILETVDENRIKGSHDDVYYGGAGDDTLVTAGGQDLLSGGTGNDDFTCFSTESFVVRGGAGHDILHLDEFSRYIETRADRVIILTLNDPSVDQVIYVYGVEEIQYDAAHPL